MLIFSYRGDQYVTNYTIGFLEKIKPFTQRIFHLKWSYLPDEFYCPGIDFSRIWEPGMTLAVPENPYLHHANWCIGIDNKIAQFKYVKALLESRRKKQA